MGNPDAHKLSSDKPIPSLKDDLLGRADFARSLADAISGQRSSDNLVIALYGPWGCGKTSVINMTLEALREKENESEGGKHTVVKFNPWELADKSQIIAELFSEISNQVDPDTSPKLSNLKRLFMKYGARLTLSAIGPAMSIAAHAGFIDPSVAGPVSGGIAAFSGIIKDLNVERQSSKGPTLGTLKSYLAHELGKFDGKILVVVDDLDRLDPEEVSLMFKVIKANLDLPNMVFLLAFQRDIVERALTRGDSTDAGHFSGENYLEKIVQVGFDVPTLRREDVGRFLFKELDSILEDSFVSEKSFDRDRWARYWTGGMFSFFRNLRDIRRYLNSLKFVVGLLRSESVMEVDILDLMALECLRVFEPTLYRGIADSKDLVTAENKNYTDEQSAVAKEKLQRLVASADNEDSARNLFLLLFPNCRWPFEDGFLSHFYPSDSLNRLSVSHPDNFDRYLCLRVPEDDVSEEELAGMLSDIDDTDRIVERIVMYIESGRKHAILSRLPGRLSDLPEDKIPKAVLALLNAGSRIKTQEYITREMFDIDVHMKLMYMVMDTLMKCKQEDRLGILESVFRETTDIYLSVRIANYEIKHASEPRKHGEPLVAELDLPALKNAALSLIARSRNEGRLKDSHNLGFVLRRWAEWGDPNEASEYARELVKSPVGLIKFLSGFLLSSTVWQGTSKTVNYYMKLDELEQLVSLSDIDTVLGECDISSLDGEERITADTYGKAKAKKAMGDDAYNEWVRHGED